MQISVFALALFFASALAIPSYAGGKVARSVITGNVAKSILGDHSFIKRQNDTGLCDTECSSASDQAGLNAVTACNPGDVVCDCTTIEALSSTCETCWVGIAGITTTEFAQACAQDGSLSLSQGGGAASSSIQSAASTIGVQASSASLTLAQASASSTAAAAGASASSPATQPSTSPGASSPSPSPTTKSGGMKMMSMNWALIGGGLGVIAGVSLA